MSDELPVFSDQEFEFETVNQFKNFHNFKQESVEKVISRDGKKSEEIEKNIEVEHHYVDFQVLQIGEKLRQQDAYAKGKLKFNNLYYSRLLS